MGIKWYVETKCSAEFFSLGVCPGPAFISSLTLNSNAITVTGSMIFGFILYDTLFPPTC